MTLEERVDKLERALPEIMSGITEIKTILNERKEQENFKDGNVEKQIADINKKLDIVLTETPKIKEHERRINNIEESQKWLKRTCAGALIVAVIELLFVLIKQV